MNIYPTRRAIALMAAGAGPALLVALAAPNLWLIAAGWVLLVFSLMAVDLVLAPSPAGLELRAVTPRSLGVGRPGEAVVRAAFEGAAPRRLEIATGGDARVAVQPERRALTVTDGAAE
ncbi:MAG: hypothetical protein JWP49_119, partial [Phenylobacterium sp.]|nr:hypothetical protein [Phenylobacterium sp.]